MRFVTIVDTWGKSNDSTFKNNRACILKDTKFIFIAKNIHSRYEDEIAYDRRVFIS